MIKESLIVLIGNLKENLKNIDELERVIENLLK